MVDIDAFLKKRIDESNLRTLKPIEKRNGSVIYKNREVFFDFSSNDYLGLSSKKELIDSVNEVFELFGSGAVASRLLSGDLAIHHELEELTASFKKKEDALIFNSGYQANVGIISALCGKNDVIFLDRLSHASLVDGALLSGAKIFRFSHNDLNHLELLLKKEREKFKNALIVTESVFSMDGDFAPLKEIVELKDRFSCEFLVDEAHATGVYGSEGSGLIEELGLTDRIELIMGTYGKALAVSGAYLASSKKIKEYLINSSRSFIYSTAMPAIVVSMIIKSIDICKKEHWRRDKVKNLASLFRGILKEADIPFKGDSQIVAVIIGDNQKTVNIANYLQNNKFWVLPIRYPTVPMGEARLRISFSSNHTEDVTVSLAKGIIEAFKKTI